MFAIVLNTPLHTTIGKLRQEPDQNLNDEKINTISNTNFNN